MDLDYPKDALNGQTERVVAMKAFENPKLKPSMRRELEEKIAPPDIPDEYIELWEVFWELFSGERMSYMDIYAYAKLYDFQFTTSDLALLRLMDNVACKYVSDEMKKKTTNHKKGT